MTGADSFTIYDGSEFTVLERPSTADGPLVMRFRLVDHCGAPPPHVHPSTTEVFEVEEGTFEMLVGSEWRTVSAGEAVVVEAGTKHTFRNHSGDLVVIRNVHEPHHEFEAYLRAVAQLTHDLEVTSVERPGTAARMAIIWRRHRDLIQPSGTPLRIAFGLLAGAGRLLRLNAPGA